MSGAVRATATPARSPRRRPAKTARPLRTLKSRALGFHRGEDGRPLDRAGVVKKMRESRRYFFMEDRYRPDLIRICRGKVQIAIVLSILRYTLGEKVGHKPAPEYTRHPILPRDIAYENGVSIEGARDHYEDLIGRGVIARKGTEGSAFYLVKCCLENWASIRTVELEEPRTKRGESISVPSSSKSAEVESEDEVTDESEGEDKGNVRGVATPLEQPFVLAPPASYQPVRGVIPVVDIVISKPSTAHLHCRSRVSCQVCHSQVAVGITPRMQGGDRLLIDVASATLLDPSQPASVDLEVLSTGLIERGYTLLPKKVREIATALGATPLKYFWRKIFERNHLQGGRAKPIAQLLPAGSVVDFATDVAAQYSLEKAVLGERERAQKQAEAARERQYELDLEYSNWRDEQALALFSALSEEEKATRRKAKVVEIKKQFPNLPKPGDLADQYIRRDLALTVKPFDQWLASRRR